MHSPRTSTLIWHDAEETTPDDCTTVIVAFADGDTAHGYWDTENAEWRSLENVTFNAPVEFWAECPETPTRHAPDQQ
jgi:hypothetical protein